MWPWRTSTFLRWPEPDGFMGAGAGQWRRHVTTSVDRPRSTIASSCCQGSSNCAANSSIAATATDVARSNASISMSSREPK